MTKVKLRPYQAKIITSAARSVAKGNNPIIFLPTGGGKSIVISDIATRIAARGQQVAIIVRRLVLVKQLSQTLRSLYGYNCGIVQGSTKTNSRSNIFVCSSDTIVRRKMPKWFQPKFFLLDECHEVHAPGMLKFMMGSHPSAVRIGLTGTPFRYHLKNGIGFAKYDGEERQIFDEIINHVSTMDLIKTGFLTPPVYFAPASADLTGLKRRSTGEFDENEQTERFRAMNSSVVDYHAEYGQGQPNLVFNCNIEHTIEVHEEFKKRGYKSAYIHSNLKPVDAMRLFGEPSVEGIIKAFKAGKFDVLNVAQMCSTGFDYPALINVTLNRAICSHNLLNQCMGRGSRLYPGKDQFRVIDLGDNIRRMGYLWEHLGSLPFRLRPTPKRERDDEDMTKLCMSCNTVASIFEKKCPNCGAEFPRAERIEREVVYAEKQKLAKFVSDPSFNNAALYVLRGKRRSDLQLHELRLYCLIKGWNVNAAPFIAADLGLVPGISPDNVKQKWRSMNDSIMLSEIEAQTYNTVRAIQANNISSESLKSIR